MNSTPNSDEAPDVFETLVAVAADDALESHDAVTDDGVASDAGAVLPAAAGVVVAEETVEMHREILGAGCGRGSWLGVH